MNNPIFGPALMQMPSGTCVASEPVSFQRYVAENGLRALNTAQYISVDALERLAPELREAQTMVLRLGRAGSTTQFVLVRAPDVRDFFLMDVEIFDKGDPVTFTPEMQPEALLPYHVFPQPTETTLVNLAFASGLIGRALGLDKPYPTAAPATGASTYSFDFRPHRMCNNVLHHHEGQVEIDTVFVGGRRGTDHLFVLESKATDERSLAKHKLVYPVLALAASRKVAMPIVTVYVRVRAQQG